MVSRNQKLLKGLCHCLANPLMHRPMNRRGIDNAEQSQFNELIL